MNRGLYGNPCYWRPTMQPARMFAWDARLFPLVLLALLHFRLWTVLLAAAALAGALVLEKKGMSVPASCRRVRSWLAGRRRLATSRPPRRAVCWSDECEGGWRWDPASCRPVPPPRWMRAASKRFSRQDDG